MNANDTEFAEGTEGSEDPVGPRYDEPPAGVAGTIDVAAAAHIDRFLDAFPDTSWQAMQAHLADGMEWVLEISSLQGWMARRLATQTGQRPA